MSKTNVELAHEVLEGKWGNGDDRVKRLTQNGYDYDEVQTIVNKLLQGETIEEVLEVTVDLKKYTAIKLNFKE